MWGSAGVAQQGHWGQWQGTVGLSLMAPIPQGPGGSAALQDQGGAETARGAAAGQEGGDHQNPVQGGGGQEVTTGWPQRLHPELPIPRHPIKHPGLLPTSLCLQRGGNGWKFLCGALPHRERGRDPPEPPSKAQGGAEGLGEVEGLSTPRGEGARAGRGWSSHQGPPQTPPAAPGQPHPALGVDGQMDTRTGPGLSSAPPLSPPGGVLMSWGGSPHMGNGAETPPTSS